MSVQEVKAMVAGCVDVVATDSRDSQEHQHAAPKRTAPDGTGSGVSDDGHRPPSVPGIVPQVDHRLVQVMVIAQHAQGRRRQVEIAAFSGG